MLRFKLAFATAVACASPSAVHATDLVSLVTVDDRGVALSGQQQLAGLLEARGIKVRGLAEIGNALARGAPPSQDDRSQNAKLRRRLDAVDELFHKQQTGTALAEIAALVKLLETNPRATRGLRVELELWRAAIALAASESDRTHEAIRRALVIDPRLVVDLNRFFPSIAAMVEAERDAIELAPLTLRGVPESATVWLDGERAEVGQQVGLGSHLVHAAAPGFTSVTARVVIGAGGAVSLSMPFAFDADVSALLADPDAAGAGSWVASCRQLPDRDCAFVLLTNALATAAVARGGEVTTQRFVAGRLDAVADWIAAALRTNDSATSPSSLAIHIGMVPFSSRSFRVDWDGRAIEKLDEGGGLVFGLSWRERWLRSTLFARADLGVARMFEARVSGENISSTLPSRAGPGWWLEANLRGGYQRWLYDDRVAVVPQLVVSVLDQRVSDVSDGGGDVGLFSSSTQIVFAPSLGLLGRASSSLVVSASIALGVVGLYAKEPRGLGEAGDPSTVLFNLGARWLLSAQWEIDLALSLVLIEVEASGAATSRVDPPPRDADLSTTVGRGAAILVRRF